jgi:hypothetical protein
MGNSSAAPPPAAKRRPRALSGLLLALGVSSLIVSAKAADVANVDDARIIEGAAWVGTSAVPTLMARFGTEVDDDP